MFYVNHGYINSGAVLDDQVIKKGIVNLRIAEGRISAIHLRREKSRLTDKYLSNSIARAMGPPHLMPRLEQRLLLVIGAPGCA